MSLTEEDWRRIAKGMVDRNNEKESIAETGLYMGGEQIVERLLPGSSVLHASLEDVIRAGIGALADRYLTNLLSEREVADRIMESISRKEGLSLVRFGDGELLTLAQETVLSIEEVKRLGSFLPYAGVVVPDLEARDALLQTFYKADIVGIPIIRRPTYQNLFIRLAKHYDLPLNKLRLTSSIINYTLQNTDIYRNIFFNDQNKILLIGNRMAELKEHLERNGCRTIVGTIPVEGVKSVRKVVRKAKAYEYDIAIVSGGVSATIICPLLSEKGKIAIDFGHLSDELIYQNRMI
ncbi:GT-D fold domain-containing glycosyltransferase [Paenibacillus sp.]|uniref:GT-D fold domain-containing protein n=1 Tax=Paenibacillus sp. TaxID=58172 RepID=UPI002D45479C|nr:GT-D fold domain-containing glycosyltransferase [Paenibacillus sp.]HZG88202.1 GT-D fold domain-containing glycosyltransferase [Paenibacillus sp.]